VCVCANMRACMRVRAVCLWLWESLYVHISAASLPIDTATHCNTLQHTATHCNTLQDIAARCQSILSDKPRGTPLSACLSVLIQRYLSNCVRSAHGAQQHTATRCNTLQHAATRCNTLQHAATHCNTLQHMTLVHNCVSTVMLTGLCCTISTGLALN